MTVQGNNLKSINARVMVLVLCMLSDVDRYYMKLREDSLNGFQVIELTWFCDGQSSKRNSSKSINAGVMFVWCWLIFIWSFVEDSLNGSKGNNSKCINARATVLRSAHRLMLIDIYMKFHEDSLNSFQVIQWTRFCDRQSCKGNNSKSINARVMVLALCTSYNVDWYLYEVSWR